MIPFKSCGLLDGSLFQQQHSSFPSSPQHWHSILLAVVRFSLWFFQYLHNQPHVSISILFSSSRTPDPFSCSKGLWGFWGLYTHRFTIRGKKKVNCTLFETFREFLTSPVQVMWSNTCSFTVFRGKVCSQTEDSKAGLTY